MLAFSLSAIFTFFFDLKDHKLKVCNVKIKFNLDHLNNLDITLLNLDIANLKLMKGILPRLSLWSVR